MNAWAKIWLYAGLLLSFVLAVGASGVIIASVYHHWIGSLLGLVAVALTVLGGLLAMTIRCANCRKPVIKRRIKLLGIDLVYWSLPLRKTCAWCGGRLDERVGRVIA
jgi:hypothetical protein